MEYVDELYNSIMRNWNNLIADGQPYAGIYGAKLLAKDFGYGLSNLTEKEAKSQIQGSYGSLCVRAFLLKPPINAKDWSKNAGIGFKKGRDGQAL